MTTPPSLFVAVPCVGSVALNFATSMLRLQAVCTATGVSMQYMFRVGSLIPFSRNELVADFMRSDASHLLWVDSDIGFAPRDAFRLAQSGYDVVAGPCRSRTDDTDLPRWNVRDCLTEPTTDGFAEVNGVGTGFMCISRSVFERMASALPELGYTENGETHYRFFDTAVVDGEYVSEDYAFCHRWRSTGGRIFVDTTCRLSHLGDKLFEGDFADDLLDLPVGA